MPYYFENAKLLIANLVDKKAYQNWKLLIGPQVNFFNQFKNKKFDFCHYDSDKSYSGRVNALKTLSPKITPQTVIIFDDIQDNLHFRDFVNQDRKEFYVLEFEDKFIGIAGKNLF